MRPARRLLALLGAVACGACAPEPTVLVEADSPAIRDGVLAESIGIETGAGEVATILEAGCRLPCAERVSFGTAEEDQGEILLYLYRGNSGRTADSTALGTFEIVGLPPGPAGALDVFVTFRAADGDLSLRADPATAGSVRLRRAAAP